MTQRRVIIVALASVAVLAIAVAVVVAWQLLGAEPTAAPDGSTPPTSSLEDGPAVVAALEKLPDDAASLVPESMRSEIQGGPAAAFPSGTTVDVNKSSWAPDEIGGGVIEITVTQPGGDPVRYVAVMAKEGESWKVLATVPVE